LKLNLHGATPPWDWEKHSVCSTVTELEIRVFRG
jgi:hypothetical protein